MFQFMKRAGFVAALAVGSMTLSSAAEARDRHDRYRGSDTTGAAIAGGVIGLALGAAIASSSRRDRYYDDYYYGAPPRYYRGYPRGGYYYDRYPRRDYYRDHYRYDRRGNSGWGNNWRGSWDGNWNGGYRRGW